MGWLVFASVVLAVIVGGWQARRRHVRQRQLMHLSHKTGLKFMPMDPFTDTMWLPFRVFGKGSRRGTENVLWDPRDDPSDVRAFDYWWVEENPEAKGSGPANRITCAVASLPFTCPRLEVLPQGSVEAAVVGDDIDLELEAFNRRFRVVADDRRFAVAFLDARMMDALMQLPPSISCAVNEDRMLLWATSLSAAQTALLLEVARKVRERVPRVVASLYPPRAPEGPHEARWLQGRWSADPTGKSAEPA